MQNRLELSGLVLKAPIRKVSPNGISHCQFFLQHASEQVEAGLKRQSWCVIPVIISGTNELIHSIKKGSKILVIGFISTHVKANNIQQLVLHASEIKLID